MRRVCFIAVFICAVSFNCIFASQRGKFFVYEPDRVDDRTSSGEVFDPSGFTVAHRFYPFGTRIQVSAGNGNSFSVIVNDRIDAPGEVFACTHAVASKLGFADIGIGDVHFTVVAEGDNHMLWTGTGGNRWYSLKNVRSSDLADTYCKLVSRRYKVRHEGDSLTVMYIVEHMLPVAMKELEECGVAVDSIERVTEEQNPLRQ